MDCVPYINDLQVEIEVLKNIKTNSKSNVHLIDKQIMEKQHLVEQCKENLKNVSYNQIYYRLYLAMLEGLSPSEAVKKIADENYYSNVKPSAPSNIWNYYKKLQKLLKQE